jgi:Holliday junction resolvase RusA-like endonuclease
MKPVKVVFYGKPKGWTAPHFSPMQKRMYSSRDYTASQARCRSCAKDAQDLAGNTEPYGGPVQAKMTFYHLVPKNWPRAKRMMVKTDEIRPVVKPDIDNVEKAIHDACKGVIFDDDNQIVKVTKDKKYALTEEEARIEVEYSRWP